MQEIQKTVQQLETLKVLVADDDPPTRILLRAAVSQWGYDVIEAKDGEEAWELLQKENAPQLLILDWMMPNLDGVSLCARIKQQIKSQCYVILLTQMSGTTNIVRGLEAGADEFLSKPFNMVELRSRLSVGARIVKFKNSLEKSNNELKNYSAGLKKISLMMLDFSESMNHFFDVKDFSDLQKVQKLKDEIQKITRFLESAAGHDDDQGGAE